MELKITFVTHACLKIKGNFGTLLCDPWILNEPVYNYTTWKFPPVEMEPEIISKDVDYLLITHSHEDHFHIPSLQYFNRDIKIILPEYTNHPSLRAHTVERCLRALGFNNIRKFKPWDRFFLNRETPLTFIPSASSREHDWENCGFIIEHSGCTVLNMNDNLNDRALCYEIASKFPKIDIAFVQTAGVTMYPGCFKMSEEQMQIEANNRTHSFKDQKQLIQWLRPKIVAPFAGDFCWLDEKYFHNNWANRATPDIFDEMIKKDFKDMEIEVLIMNPSDEWSSLNGVRRLNKGINWINYLDEIRSLQFKYRHKIDSLNKWINSSDKINLMERSQQYTNNINEKITKDFIFFEARFRIIIEGPNSNFSFVVKSNYDGIFEIDWKDNLPVDQSLYVDENIWASIIEGKLMWNIIQWSSKALQHVPYREDMGKFWFWMEYHIDLNNKYPQIILGDDLHPNINNKIRPNLGVFENFDNT